MSFGGGYQGGRTRMGTKVYLNVYDLSPANEFLFSFGLGFHHSGVEIMGSEYSFASGAGIFESTPKEAPGAKWRERIELGTYEGGSAELRRAIDDLRSDFGSDSYNLIRKNCNHFSNALSWSLLGRRIPSHVNRLADIGSCCSCLLPRQMIEEAPVGHSGARSSGGSSSSGSNANGFQVFAGGSRSAAAASSSRPTTAFSGHGAKLGGEVQYSNSESLGLGGKGKDDLTDRREKARKAALARLERSQAQGGN